jgi:hypothetical protein
MQYSAERQHPAGILEMEVCVPEECRQACPDYRGNGGGPQKQK